MRCRAFLASVPKEPAGAVAAIPLLAIAFLLIPREKRRQLVHGLVATWRSQTFSISASNGERAGVRCRDAVIPPAVFKPACEECSLYEICLPKAVANPGRIERATHDLFRT